MIQRVALSLRAFSIASVVAIVPAAGHAHPHQWMDVASELLFDDHGRIVAIRHHWRFDEAFTAFALQGLDTNDDGLYTRDELQPLAEVNVESLAEYDFFTFVSAGENEAGFATPRDYWLDLDRSQLTLHYTLPLAEPLSSSGELLVQVYDPEYYIAFIMPSPEAVRLVGAPRECRLVVTPASGPDPAAAAALATIGPDQRELPAEMQDLAKGIDNSAALNCSEPTSPATDAQPVPTENAGIADRVMGRAELESVDVTTSAGPTEPAKPGLASPDLAGDALPISPPALAEPRPVGRFAGMVAETIQVVSLEGSKFSWLGAISFLYGVFHASRLQYGGAVVRSEFAARQPRVWRVATACLALFMQTSAAILIVGLITLLLFTLSLTLTNTMILVERISYALLAILGFCLIVYKSARIAYPGRAASAFCAFRHIQHSSLIHLCEGRTSATRAIRQGSSAACSNPSSNSSSPIKRFMYATAAAIMSVRIRPCSGALAVLLFALGQGFFWTGVWSTYLMAVAIVLTVTTLNVLPVGENRVPRQAPGHCPSNRVILAGEILAAVFIAVLGTALFVSSGSA